MDSYGSDAWVFQARVLGGARCARAVPGSGFRVCALMKVGGALGSVGGASGRDRRAVTFTTAGRRPRRLPLSLDVEALLGRRTEAPPTFAFRSCQEFSNRRRLNVHRLCSLMFKASVKRAKEPQ